VAFPAEMPHAQNLQKIFPVAEGDHAQGPSCSVEREYCHHWLKSRMSQLRLAACGFWGGVKEN